MALIDQIHQSLKTIIGPNTTQDENNTRLEEIDFVISNAFRTVYQIEKTLGLNISYDDIRTRATEVVMVFPNITSEQNVTQMADDLNRFKFYVEGVSLTTIATIGLLGRQYMYKTCRN